MALTLDTPISRPDGTKWKIRNFHVFDAEFGNPSIRIELECWSADDTTLIEQLSGALDWTAWVTEFNGIVTGANIVRLRRAILQRAQAEHSSRVGSGTAA